MSYVFCPGRGAPHAARRAIFEKLPKETQSIARACLSGTSAPAWDVDILYVGPVCALIRHRGGSYYNRGAHYVSGRIDRVIIKGGERYGGDEFTKTVTLFECGEGVRFTAAIFEKLVKATKDFEGTYAERRKAADEATDAYQAKKNAVVAHMKAELERFIEASKGNGWEYIEAVHQTAFHAIEFAHFSGRVFLFGKRQFKKGGLVLTISCGGAEEDVMKNHNHTWKVISIEASHDLLAAIDIEQLLLKSDSILSVTTTNP